MRTFMAWLAILAAAFVLPASAADIEPQTTNGITYISGGISEERPQMEAVRSQYPLQMMFALAGSGEYLADVTVNLRDRKGTILLDAVAEGPFLFVKLPPGIYQLAATSDGKTKTRTVNVPARGSIEERFYW